jgi:hypothetical protein
MTSPFDVASTQLSRHSPSTPTTISTMGWATQGCKQSWTAAKDPAHEGGLLGNGVCGRGSWVQMRGGEGKQMRNKGLEWDGVNEVRSDEGWGMKGWMRSDANHEGRGER